MCVVVSTVSSQMRDLLQDEKRRGNRMAKATAQEMRERRDAIYEWHKNGVIDPSEA